MRPQFNKIQQPFYTGEDTGGSGGLDTLSADDILAELNKADETDDDVTGEEEDTEVESDTEDKDTDSKDDKEDDKEEKDELAEIEEDLKEPTEEDLELKVPVQRRQLLKDYPDIFKKHPGLEPIIYRERAYTELLPTIQDAKEALAASATLDKFESDLMQGDTKPMMKAILQEDPKGFAKLADNYMNNLAQVDERAYHHVLGNIAKDIVETMVIFAKDKDDKDVMSAASTLYQFMFNKTKWEPKQMLSAKDVVDDSVAAERAELDKQKKEFATSKEKEHTEKLMSSIDHQIKGTIEKTIDPKGQMGAFVKGKAIDEVLSKATEFLKKDSRFQNIVKQLNSRAAKEGYSAEAMTRIKSTYFTKYKAILLPIIKSVRAEALKGTKSRIKKETEVNDTTERANRDTTVRNTSGNNGNSKKPNPGESSLDFLMRRAK